MIFSDCISAALDYTQRAEAVLLEERQCLHGEEAAIIEQMASDLFELRHRWQDMERDYLKRQKEKQ